MPLHQPLVFSETLVIRCFASMADSLPGAIRLPPVLTCNQRQIGHAESGVEEPPWPEPSGNDVAASSACLRWAGQSCSSRSRGSSGMAVSQAPNTD